MKTKNGSEIPEDLTQAIQKSKKRAKEWELLRPSCQTEYIDYLLKAKTPTTRRKYLERVLRMTTEYAKKHPDKYRK